MSMMDVFGTLAASGRRPRRFASIRGSFVVAAVVSIVLAGCQSEGASDGEAAAVSADDDPVADAAIVRQQTLVGELRAIDQALAPIRARAQADPAMQTAEETLVARMDAAMEVISPGILVARDRFLALRTEYDEAQQAGDQERMQELGVELQGLQVRLEQTQSEAMAQEDVTAAIETFREGLFAWMRAEDPRADSLLDRADVIGAELEAMAAPDGG